MAATSPGGTTGLSSALDESVRPALESALPAIEPAKVNQAEVVRALDARGQDRFDVGGSRTDGISLEPPTDVVDIGRSAHFRLAYESPEVHPGAAQCFDEKLRPLIEQAKAQGKGSVFFGLDARDKDHHQALQSLLKAEGIALEPAPDHIYASGKGFRLFWESPEVKARAAQFIDEKIRPSIDKANVLGKGSVVVTLDTRDKDNLGAVQMLLEAEGISVGPAPGGISRGLSSDFRLSWESPAVNASAAQYIEEEVRPSLEEAKGRGEGSVAVTLDTHDKDRLEALKSLLKAEGIDVNAAPASYIRGFVSEFRLTWS